MRQVVVRWSGGIPGFGDARPEDGRYVVSQPGVCVVTDKGPVPEPDGRPARYLRLPPSGDRFACTWSNGGPDRAKEWTGLPCQVCGAVPGKPHLDQCSSSGTHSSWWDRGLSCGTNAVIYGLDGAIYVSRCEAPQGPLGWRYVDEATGRLVTCAETYAYSSLGLYEWTAWPDVRIGQGTDGAVVWFPDLGLRRLSFEALRATGKLYNVRARRAGDAFAITVVDYDKYLTTVTWATLAELRMMPDINRPVPAVPQESIDMLKPSVNVTRFGGLITPNGWVTEFEDKNNPGHKVRLFTENGSLRIRWENPEGSNTTGAVRRVV